MRNEASQPTEKADENYNPTPFKIFCWLSVVTALAGIYIASFIQHDKTTEGPDSDQNDQAFLENSLAFAPGNNPDWSWWLETNQVQQQTSKQGKTLLRKVDLDDETAVYAVVAASHQLITYVKFVVDCTPGKEVNASGKINDEIIEAKLKCSDTADGLTALYYNKVWQPGERPEVWRGNISGFDFYASFKDWNLDPLFREEVLAQAR